MKHWIGRRISKLIIFLARLAKVDLIKMAYVENGIMKSHSYVASGESHFTSKELPKLVPADGIFFDVGANKGDYSNLLLSNFPKATIYSFEPNPNTFKMINERLGNRINLYQLGVGKEKGSLELFFDSSNKTSVEATSNPEILKEISKTQQIDKVDIDVTTLDSFCQENSINQIDFLKIDTEGFELDALEGASNLLDNGKIKVIQFEFNETSIIQRRFLKDYYEKLQGFDFYRLDEKRMIPLETWKPIHEIFMFQNIVAIKK